MKKSNVLIASKENSAKTALKDIVDGSFFLTIDDDENSLYQVLFIDEGIIERNKSVAVVELSTGELIYFQKDKEVLLVDVEISYKVRV